MFTLLELLDTEFVEHFVMSAKAHVDAASNHDRRLAAASAAAEASVALAEVCASIMIVERFCQQQGVESTSFDTPDIMRRAPVQLMGR